jgi:hypothetical protein
VSVGLCTPIRKRWQGVKEERTYVWFGVGHFVVVLRFQGQTSIRLVIWGKVRSQLVLHGRDILQSIRGCRRPSLTLYFPFAQKKSTKTLLYTRTHTSRQVAMKRKKKRHSRNSSRSPAIVARNSSTSHLCAFASDSAAFFVKSASEICGFGFDPEPEPEPEEAAAGVSQVLIVAIASRSDVSNAPSRSNAASGVPSGKRSIVANGGGYAHRIARRKKIDH